MNVVFLGIGSNLGSRELNLEKAVAGIEEYIGPVMRSSSVFETEPWGFSSGDVFLNMVVKAETGLSPSGLLGRIMMIEALSGRVRGAKQYTSRILDIDILLFNDIVLDDPNLKIPHPLLHERRFVLVPLCEIEPEMIHPVLKKSFISLLRSCKDNNVVRIFEV